MRAFSEIGGFFLKLWFSAAFGQKQNHHFAKGDNIPIARTGGRGQTSIVIAEFAAKYRFCPQCGEPVDALLERPPFKCAHCGLVLYFNPAVAAAALIFNPEGKILAVKRARNPSQGKLAFPGGFIDADETAEEAVRREVREEVGLELERVEYLCSSPNQYPYQGVTYLVLDFFFLAWTQETGRVAEPGEVQSLFWATPESITPDDLAFPSLRNAWSYYQNVWRPNHPAL